MSNMQDKRRQDEVLKVAEQAAEWLLTLENASTEERTAFAEWIEESPLHVEMFLRATAVDQLGAVLGPERRQQFTGLVSAGPESNVVNLGNGIASAVITPQHRQGSSLERKQVLQAQRSATGTLPPKSGSVATNFRMSRRNVGIAAAIVAAASGLLWHYAATLQWEQYSTTLGEQRAIPLNDGSVVYVNTRSRVDVRYSNNVRDVRLVSGEALFKVQHDPRRPFRVHIDEATVQAIGTQFNIYRKPSQTIVAVIEGAVQVTNKDKTDQKEKSADVRSPEKLTAPGDTPALRTNARRLNAGQAVRLTARAHIESPATVDVAQVTAWRQRRLVFEWQTLATIAAEFNRYNRAPQIRLEGKNIRERRYTAVFDADDPKTLLKFLERDRDLKFIDRGDELIIQEE